MSSSALFVLLRVFRAISGSLLCCLKKSLGSQTRVEVKLQDKTKLRGQISGTDSDSFYLDNLAGGNTKVLYSDVSEVKKGGGGWSTKHWIILGAVAGGLVNHVGDR